MPHDRRLIPKRRIYPALALLQAIVFTTPAPLLAAEPIDCSPAAAAGRQAPPSPAKATEQAFQIFWHIGTQMEELADVAPDSVARKEIADVQKHVNGYYITVHPNQLGYWAKRPSKCAVNFMRARDRVGDDAVQNLRDTCNRNFAASVGGDGGDSKRAAIPVYRDALARVIRNLDLKGEQARGKMVIGQMLLINTDFRYDDTGTQLSLRRLPITYCYLNAAGLSVNNVLAYQEPGVQIRQGRFLVAPRAGSRADPTNGRREALPFNLNLVEQLDQAFAQAHAPLSQFAINVRRWDERMSSALAAKPRDEHIGGIFFEGGAEIISTKRRKIPRVGNFAEGIAWLLANSDENIFMLMPGFWEKDELTSTEDRDELIPQLRKTVMTLNQEIERRLPNKPNKPAICNERMHFIPGTYGSPAHVKPLPAERNGKLAGTVSGEIMLLAQMRREMCGTSG
jgi:hypothetical protein